MNLENKINSAIHDIVGIIWTREIGQIDDDISNVSDIVTQEAVWNNTRNKTIQPIWRDINRLIKNKLKQYEFDKKS